MEETIYQELNIPRKQIKETSVTNRFIVLTHKTWIKNLLKYKKLVTFPSYKSDISEWPRITDIEINWEFVYLVAYKKHSHKKVIPLQKCKDDIQDNLLPLTYSQLLQHVQQNNHKNLWKLAHKKYAATDTVDGKTAEDSDKWSHKKIPADVNQNLLPYDLVLRDCITRMYNCTIIHSKLDRVNLDLSDSNNSYLGATSVADYCEPNCNLLSLLATIESSSHYYLIYNYVENTMLDCLAYSPAILENQFNKNLFIIYQLLDFMKIAHSKGLFLGTEFGLKDILIDKNLRIYILPKLDSNLIQYEESEVEYKQPVSAINIRTVDYQNTLRDYCEMWCTGKLSNFDYLTILNNFAGRKINSPYNHHIIPWVIDFTSRQGNFRDLTKSKYRLNKGDRQLDLTFTTCSTASPHHVSDILSEITYYVYMARKTSKSVLCKHVRSKFVANEYPASIARMYAWSPDECIPEFYSDPTVFKSIHEDLPDLEIPNWSTCPEDFVAKHREALESQYVSENLHHWIDLNFGYKLSGKHAIKAKNVCLSLVDQHKDLCQRGVVQLFQCPHPPKQFKNVWFGKVPPRITCETQKRLTRSSEDLSMENLYSNEARSSTLSTSPRVSTSRIHQSESIERSTSYHISVQKPTNQISLPKNYNPIAQLKAVENMENFLSKTFHEKQSKAHQPRNPNDDPSLLTTSFHNYLSERYETDSENAFTNRMFLETYEASLVKDNKMYRNMKHKNLISQNSKRNFKHLVSENRLKEVQVVGCLIVELFLLSKLRPLVPMDQNFEDRLEACQKMLKHNLNLLPRCIQYPVKLMFGMCSEDEEKIITDKGLPTSSLSNLLMEPILSNILLPFPVYYIRLNAAIKILFQFESTSRMLSYYTFFECNGKICQKYDHLERAKMLINRRIAECKLKSFVVMVDDLMGTSGFEQFDAVEVLLPHILELLHNDETSILAAWYLFDSIATALGIQETKKKLLQPILRLYDIENDQEVGMWNNCGYDSSRGLQTSTSIFRSKKAVKLYHHSFLLKLIVRFGLKCFLDHFIVPLIEAVGGHKDLCQQEQQQHFHGSFVSPKRSLKYKLESTSIEEKASSSHYDIDREEVFKLETDEGRAEFDIDQEIDTEQVLMKMLDQFELKSDTSSIDLKLTHSTADEAKEGIAENDDMHVNDFMVGDEKIKIYSSSPEKSTVRDKIQSDPKSPEIPIPSSFRRSIQVNSIGCEIGSRKSTDSFDFLSKTPNESTKTAFEGSEKNNESGKPSKATEKLPKATRSTRISEMSSESLIWLAHRLGPLLTARYLTRNLLKMLTLCYVSQENLLPNSSEESNICFFTLCDGSVIGDQNSQNVMECLTSISALFGEEFILMQYFPHISELIALTKKKITINLEGGIIGALQLLKCLIPCLSDAIILEHLQDSILTNMINPVIRLLSSSRFVMPSGYLARNVLARKLLDTIYTLSVRIGPDMTMQHICVPALQRFFLIFDKAYGIPESVKDSVTGEQESQFNFDVSRESVSSGSTDTSTYCEMQKEKDVKATEYKIKKNSIQPTNDPDAYNPMVGMSSRVSTATREKGLEEIRDVFTPSLAHTAYTLFLNQLGDHIMTKTVKNLGLILNLSHEHEIPNYSSFDNKFESTQIQDVPEKKQATDVVDSNSFDSNVAVIGNRIDVQFDNDTTNSVNINEIQELVSYKLETFVSNRKLRGNWLAYWQNEIGRSEKDTSFNMQQIKLQQYSGHTNSIRSILCLDNENSFMTASKDKTVKLWSLRNEGDGTKVSTCQYTYNNHRKSVHSLAFLESLRLAVSCDSGVHMWDPFVGTLINQLDSHKYAPVSVVKCYPSPSSLILAGTADSTLKFIDARLCDYVMEWKITPTPSGSVRCLAVAPSGLWVAVGLSSGYVSIVDARSGMLMSSWRASEGELLQLIALNDNELISSSIDQNLSIWNISNGFLKIHFKNPPEPVHCIKLFENQMIAATPANRLGAFEFGHELQDNPQIPFTKLRSDIFKGILSSFTILPLNRMLLAGSESGQITLLI